MTVSRKLVRYGVAILIICFAIGAVAQEKVNPTDTGSLAALTAEVRQLRLAVEESTQRQTQTQALGVYLSVQQSRITQVAARLDAAHKELDALTVRSKNLTDTISRVNEVFLRETNAQARAGLEQEIRSLKQELESVALQEQQVRSREAELFQMLRTEDSRWTDLVSALETLIKK